MAHGGTHPREPQVDELVVGRPGHVSDTLELLSRQGSDGTQNY